MEQENNTYSDTSTAESHHNNHPEKQITRLYDCVFCKRGFTNAQALGGHMNIHRKDKAKAKKKNHEDRLSIQSFNSNSSFSPRIVTADFFQVIGGHVDDRVYLPPPPANYEYCFFPVWSRANNLDDRTYQNLNLRTGAGHHEEEEEEEVDLELRLGRLL